MAARRKGRSRFECKGRYYHWYHDDNWRIHICSEDKKFAVAYVLGNFNGVDPHLEVSGPEFTGIDAREPRPVRLFLPRFVHEEFSKSVGAFVNAVIRWSVRPSHRLRRIK